MTSVMTAGMMSRHDGRHDVKPFLSFKIVVLFSCKLFSHEILN